MNKISRSLAAMSLVLLAMGGGASAATYTWTGGSLADGTWTDTANWSGGSAPPGGVTDDLLFTSNPSNWIAAVASPITVHNMTNNIGMTFSGSSISITGTTPVVAIAPNTTNTYNNDLVIGTGTKFGSTVNAANTSTVVFNGQLSGAMLTYANNLVNSTTSSSHYSGGGGG